jgi:hypothetical protein
MRSRTLLATLAVGSIALAGHAHAHGFAGDHMFVSTLLIDDPNVADEASLPTFSYLPQPTDGGPASNLYGLGFEFDKRITENFGFAINTGYNWLTQPGAKTANGWSNLVVTLKYKPYVNDEHEFLVSVGVQRVIARSGANGSNGAVLGNDDSSSTIPTLYFAKGFGDIPVGWVRPFMLTGELGYAIADKKLKVDPVDFTPVNNGNSNAWTGGLSLQYSRVCFKVRARLAFRWDGRSRRGWSTEPEVFLSCGTGTRERRANLLMLVIGMGVGFLCLHAL